MLRPAFSVAARATGPERRGGLAPESPLTQQHYNQPIQLKIHHLVPHYRHRLDVTLTLRILYKEKIKINYNMT